MSFPTSPIDGQIYKDYVWQTDSWIKADSYNPSGSTNMGRLIMFDSNNRPGTITLGLSSSSRVQDLSSYIPTGAKGVLVNARPTALAGAGSVGLMIWPDGETGVTDWTNADVFLWLDGFYTPTARNVHFDSLITRVSTEGKIRYIMSSSAGSTIASQTSCTLVIRGYYI